MKHFIQHRLSRGMLKAAVGFLLLLTGLQQGYGQCISCDGTTTSGLFPSAIGRYTQATGNYSFAGGIYSEAQGQASMAFGNRTYATGANSIVLGMFLKTNTSPAIVLGAGFDVNNRLENAVPYSMMIGFGSTKPTLFVGPSIGVNSTGKIGIGNVTDPQAKLHIRADQYDDASLLLEATGSNKRSSILMAGGQAVIGTSSQNHSLSFVTGTTHTRMFINGVNGNVGIGGTTNPQSPLHVMTDGTQDAAILIESTDKGKAAGIYFSGSAANIGILDQNKPISFYTAGTNLKMRITSDGNVGIGVAAPQQKLHVAGGAKFDDQVLIDAGGLYVNGEVKAKKFHASISPFPDFVFEPGYQLLPITEVESFITEKGHLPGFPNAAEVEKNGIELGEMNALLLQKIEELTLYIIAQQKEIGELRVLINSTK